MKNNLLIKSLLLFIFTACCSITSWAQETETRRDSIVKVEKENHINAIISEEKVLAKRISFKYEVGYDFLIKGEDEVASYGLYSYLLFSQIPSEDNKEKYRKIIETFLSRIQSIENFTGIISKDSLNISYIPITKKPDASLRHCLYQKKVLGCSIIMITVKPKYT